jgi:hypothetical protein
MRVYNSYVPASARALGQTSIDDNAILMMHGIQVVWRDIHFVLGSNS